jgi:antitoxin component YwqK of YwqJK toxin-antitoxin module
MSGLQMTTENDNITSIIEQIKASQQNVLKAFEDHNIFVNKSLEKLQQIKTETKVEVVKVKDPLEELKKVRDEYKDRELSGYLRTLILVKIEKCLSLYKDAKISTTFKEIFLKLFNEGLQFKGEFDHLFFNRRMFKEAILKVRDIRWLLLEMEKYPQIFGFNEDDLELMKQHNASRDNIYLVKKFLKKDGDYEEYHSEEEGGGIKCQYHMTGGLLNGEYKKWYNNGQMNFQGYYKDGERENEYKSWRPTGQLLEHMIYNKDGTNEYKMWYENEQIWMHMYSKGDKREGEYKRWYEDGKLMVQKFYKDGEEEGECKWWHPNGRLASQGYYKEGKLEGEFKSWDKDGQLLEHIVYGNEGKIVKLKRYHNCGVLDLEKTLIENDTYELTRYYECDGKIHDQVIMVGNKWNGEYNSWWHNGNKCIETTYKDHKLHGNYLYWNEEGTLKEKCFYKDGEKQV